jgi:multiple sugar transport system permease protein
MTKIQKERLLRIVYHIVVMAFAVGMIYPLLWMVFSAFKPTNTIFATAKTLLPETFTLDNFINGWKGIGKTPFSQFFKNTIWVCVVATIGAVVSCTLVAYSLARLKYKARKGLFALVLLTMMLPGEILMIPQYLWYNKLGWVSTYLPLTVPCYFAISGFFIYQIKNFIEGIPTALDEAARIDGCSVYGIFFRIILPLIKPAIATVTIFSFLNNWNNYMGALLYLRRTEKYTVSLALKLFCDTTSQSDYGAMFAMSTLSLIPIFLIFATMQKYLTQGIATSGLKG